MVSSLIHRVDHHRDSKKEDTHVQNEGLELKKEVKTGGVRFKKDTHVQIGGQRL